MLLTPEERDLLILPYKDYEPLPPGLEPPDEPSAETIIERMTSDAHATCAAAGDRAAMAVVVAVGNYEYVSFKREAVMKAAEELLDELDPSGKETHRWGP